jgi:hypothetical protein
VVRPLGRPDPHGRRRRPARPPGGGREGLGRRRGVLARVGRRAATATCSSRPSGTSSTHGRLPQVQARRAAPSSVSAVSVDSSDGRRPTPCLRVRAPREPQVRRRPRDADQGLDGGVGRDLPRAGQAARRDGEHKAAKYGLRPYMVGVSRAKDLILGAERTPAGSTCATRRQDGPRAGRMHWYRGVRADYFEQLTAEVKAPARTIAAAAK